MPLFKRAANSTERNTQMVCSPIKWMNRIVLSADG